MRYLYESLIKPNKKLHFLNIVIFLLANLFIYIKSIYLLPNYPTLTAQSPQILTPPHYVQKTYSTVLNLEHQRYLFNCEKAFDNNFCQLISSGATIEYMEFSKLDCFSAKIYTCYGIISKGIFKTTTNKVITYNASSTKVNEYIKLRYKLYWGEKFFLLMMFNFIILLFFKKI